jgi:hypothetical protein
VEPRGLSSRLTMLLYPLTRRSPDHALGTRRTSLALAASPHWRARQVVPVCVICLRLRVV